MIRVPLESNSTKYQTKEKYDETEKTRLGAKKLKEFLISGQRLKEKQFDENITSQKIRSGHQLQLRHQSEQM